MIITCSQCQAKFKVAPEQIKETGSKVRCSNCQYVFTVFRPRSQDESSVLDLPDLDSLAGGGMDGLKDYLKSTESDGGLTDDYGLGDIFGDRPAPRPDGRNLTESYEDPDDGLDEFKDFEDDGPHLRTAENQAASMRERRDRRRRLYSDLEDGNPLDDESEDGLDENELVDDDGRPPLRRSTRSAYESEPELPEDEEGDDFGEEAYDDEQYDDQAEGEPDDYYEDEPEGDYSYESTRLARQVSDLGLSADPVDPDKFIDDTAVEGRYYGASQESPSIRGAITKPDKRLPVKLIIGLMLLIIVLGAGIYFFAARPALKAIHGDEEVATQGGGGETTGGNGAGVDQIGTEGITFTRGNQNHYFRENTQAGNILIITGMVRNSYLDRRNFIRLRGHLLAADGRSLAERYVYAGNIISEDELKNLPIAEIYSRLNIRGGQDGRNMNVEPGQEIPFMLVFDKLPELMTEYRIDPVGSNPSD